jgi:hypothetical protein
VSRLPLTLVLEDNEQESKPNCSFDNRIAVTSHRSRCSTPNLASSIRSRGTRCERLYDWRVKTKEKT